MYFGEQTSFYFEFVNYLQKWLIASIVVGISVEIVNQSLNMSFANSQFELIYSVFIQVWASAFYCFWMRKEREISLRYRSYGNEYMLKFKQSESDELYDETDPISGERVKKYSSLLRFFKYIQSIILTLPLLLVTLLIIVVSLNVRGHTDRTHNLHIYALFRLSVPGAIFDRKNFLLSIIPDTLHVLVVAFLNQMHYLWAVKITKWEQHDNFHTYQRSIIWKRILFQIFSTFSVLFYIAFIKFDIVALRRELIILFSIDEIRRLLLETIIPYLTKKKRSELLLLQENK